MADIEVIPYETDETTEKQHNSFSRVQELIHERNSEDTAEQLNFLAELMYDRVSDNYFDSTTADDVAGFLEFLRGEIEQYASSDSRNLKLINPEDGEFPWETPHTVLNLVTDDLPFIIDSIYEFLKKRDIEIQHVFHNKIGINRDENGNFNGFSDMEDQLDCFFLSLHVQKQPTEDLANIREDIESVLDDIELAVADFDPMMDKAEMVRQKLQEYEDFFPEQRDLLTESREFLEYLIDGNFVFLGFRKYNIDRSNGQDMLEIEHGSGLGILQREEESSFYSPKPIDELDEKLQKRITSGFVLIVTKANSESRVYRRERLDYVGIKQLDEEGNVTGEYRFLGLFTNRVLAEPAVNIPVLRQKFEDLVQREGISEHTHTYRDVYSIYSSMPKHLLFMSPVEDLAEDIFAIIGSQGETTFKLRDRPDIYQRGMSIMVLMSKDRFNQYVRWEIQEELEEEFGASVVDYKLSLREGDFARLHFYFQTDRRNPKTCSFEELENRLYEITRTWFDRVSQIIHERYSNKEAERLCRRYENSFPDTYKTLVEPEQAVNDIDYLEKLHGEHEGPLVELTNPGNDISHLIFYHDHQIRLGDIMPMLTNHGVDVVEQTAVPITIDSSTYHLHLFQVQDPDQTPFDMERQRNRLLESIDSVYKGDFRDDILNQLVITEGLSPRTLNLFRLYKNYFHQLQPAIKLESINRTLIKYPTITGHLYNYFQTKFNPDTEFDEEEREDKLEDCKRRILNALEPIQDRNEDQVLRSIFNHMESTVRTNFYQSDQKQYISIKIECQGIEDMPEPRPLYEIYVYSPFMEAIHLRGGEIARGGIRWSDRRDDYRTEVLDLMKTQMVKNSLIVPVGSKGGFVLKQEHLEGESLQEQAKEQYKVFMRGML
ncbi:MAG: NAD-glutamate dehydrogenase domain-containing protein, partial [bacterium]